MSEEEIIKAISENFGELVVESKVLRPKKISVTVKPEGLVSIATFLRDSLGFDHPLGAGAIDYPAENKIQMVYYLWSMNRGMLVMLRADTPRDNPRLPTLSSVWDQMSLHEREAWEMFGIVFEGHPRLEHLLLPEDWEEGVYPLRKDYKLPER